MLTENKQKEIEIHVNRAQWGLLENAGFPKERDDKINAIYIVKAIESEGYSIVEINEIPNTTYRAEAVGYLDRITKTIYVKSTISQARKNFTLAHELGHILMHKNMDVMHRQVSRKKGLARPALEQEADYFASCWLMPKLLVIKQFQIRFINSPLIFTDNVAYHLSKSNQEKQDLLEAKEDQGIREFALAKSTSYNLKSFESLANFFKVSPEAMAYRLQELNLIEYP